MKILLCEPQKRPKVVDIPHTLEAMQETVGGLIQAIYPWDDPVALVCDEEGLFKDTPWNRLVAPDVAIKGTFFICGLTDDDFGDISDALLEKYRTKFWFPQMLVYEDETPVWIPFKPMDERNNFREEG